jgi:DNA-binding transcriptional LysR family regulator
VDELARIRTFIKVVETGSFSAAARNDSSTSSVARQIKSLEDELGVRLLNRTTRSLSLTEPGRLLYERSMRIARDLNDVKQEVQSFQASVKGQLRVSLRGTAGPTIIVPALPKLLEKHPELSLDITLTNERQDLVADNIDVAVWLGEMPDSEYIARRLSPSQRVVCASPGYLARHGVPQVPTDVTDHQCVIFSAPSYRNIWFFRRSEEEIPVDVKGKIRSDNGLVLLEAALADMGLITAHEWMVRRLVQQGRLKHVLTDYTVSPTSGDADLWAVFPSNRGMSKKVRAFIDFLVELFQAPNATVVSQHIRLLAPNNH